MYRFRSIDSLFDKFQELEKQEIYFASPTELNDAIEGFMDVFWQGDNIVWKNLLRTYIRSVENFMIHVLLFGEKKLGEKDIRLAFFDKGLYADNSTITQAVIDNVFSYSFVGQLPNMLAAGKRPVRRQELMGYLNLMHH